MDAERVDADRTKVKMENIIRNDDDRLRLAGEWARVGGGFAVEPAGHSVVIEELLVRSAIRAPADHRLFFVAATWLGMHHHLVDLRRLGRDLEVLRGLHSAVAGAMISVAGHLRPAARLDAVTRHCQPLEEPRPLFDRIAANPHLTRAMRQDSLPLYSRWGLWHDEVSLKVDAVKPVRWILERCPELRVRALIGASLEGEIVEALLGEPRTVAQLARTTGATYASAHEAAGRLAARGLVERVNDGGRRGLALASAVERWIDAYPSPGAGRKHGRGEA